MVSARYERLSYPTYFLNSNGSVIRNTFLEYGTKHVHIFVQRNVFIHYLPQLYRNI